MKSFFSISLMRLKSFLNYANLDKKGDLNRKRLDTLYNQKILKEETLNHGFFLLLFFGNLINVLTKKRATNPEN